MIDQYQIQKLQALPIEQVAEELGLRVSRHKAICPFHDDTRPSLTFDVRRNRYRCYVCDAHGGVIDLVMNVLGRDFVEACRWLGAETREVRTGAGVRTNAEVRTNANDLRVYEKEGKPDIPYLERLMAQPVLNDEARQFLFEERRLSPKVIKELGISSISYPCPMSSSPRPSYFDGPALLIPYRDTDGKLLSVQSRYLGEIHADAGVRTNANDLRVYEKPRFRFPRGSRCHIFNLPVLKNILPGEPLFVAEGVSDCLALLSCGCQAIAIPSATLLKKEDADLLKGHRLHMFPDRDEAGERLFLELKALFPDIVHHTLPEGFKDVGQYWAYVKRQV